MPPLVFLCMQLIIGPVWSASPYVLPAVVGAVPEDRPHLEALFSAAAGSSSVPQPQSAPHRAASNFHISKRQPPALIESTGDNLAYRQHHQPPGQQHQQQQPPDEDESFYNRYVMGHAGIGAPNHFRQLQDGSSHHQRVPLAGFAPVMGDHRDESDSSVAFPGVSEMENEIANNPLFGGGNKPHHPAQPLRADTVESLDLIRESLERIKEQEDIEIKSELLMRMLEQLPDGPLPIVYVEDATATSTEGGEGEDDAEEENGAGDAAAAEGNQFTSNADKRSGRYYRRYPWKRQNARSRTYDADARYLCVPSRDDVFKLLVGLHEHRVGNNQRTINFCNRKRPAKAIFTNIRFLG